MVLFKLLIYYQIPGNCHDRTNCPLTDFINPPLGEFKLKKLANEAGVFIKAKVNGLKANVLMDTGATVTLVNTRLLKSMTSPV